MLNTVAVVPAGHSVRMGARAPRFDFGFGFADPLACFGDESVAHAFARHRLPFFARCFGDLIRLAQFFEFGSQRLGIRTSH